MRCPACAIVHTSATSQTTCSHCGAELHLQIWKATRPAYMRFRFLASLIDHALFGLMALFVLPICVHGVQLFYPQTNSVVIQTCAQSVLYLLYFSLWTSVFSTTPGKWVCRLRVLDAQTGQRLTLKQAWNREGIGRFVCGMLISPVGYLTVLNPHSRAQTWADLWAGTVVVRRVSTHSKSTSP